MSSSGIDRRSLGRFPCECILLRALAPGAAGLPLVLPLKVNHLGDARLRKFHSQEQRGYMQTSTTEEQGPAIVKHELRIAPRPKEAAASRN